MFSSSLGGSTAAFAHLGPQELRVGCTQRARKQEMVLSLQEEEQAREERGRAKVCSLLSLFREHHQTSSVSPPYLILSLSLSPTPLP